jgi:hypothetical protein
VRRYKLRAMNNDPLECICSHRVERLQLKFARQASRILPPRPDRAFEVSHQGLLVSGETEASLASVIDVWLFARSCR